MSGEPSYTFFAYSPSTKPESVRWAYTGVPESFFGDAESARRALLDLRKDVTAQPDVDWSPMRLEKIETHPITKETLLALLNDGVGSLVKNYEIIDVID